MPLHWREKPHTQAQITVSSEQNCSAIPICWEVKASLSERVNERLKWILANSAHLPWCNINHWSFQWRWVIKWSFSRDRKGVKGTAGLQLPLAGTNPPDPILRNTLGCVTARCGLWGDSAPVALMSTSGDITKATQNFLAHPCSPGINTQIISFWQILQCGSWTSEYLESWLQPVLKKTNQTKKSKKE